MVYPMPQNSDLVPVLVRKASIEVNCSLMNGLVLLAMLL